MNAVNLIPLERRRGEAPSLPGLPFMGLVAALVLALAGTFVYVGARNQVSSRQSELARVNAGTSEWTAAASRYAPAISTLKQRSKRFEQLGTLLGQRAEWSVLLGQVAGVMPAHAELASMSAASSASSGSSSTGSTSPGITISGCAVSQAVVADTMVALRRLSGVSAVSLSNSTLQGGSGGSASSGGATTGSCKLAVAFSLTLQFTPPTDLVQLLEGGQGGAGDSTTSTTAQASSTSNSTGSAQ